MSGLPRRTHAPEGGAWDGYGVGARSPAGRGVAAHAAGSGRVLGGSWDGIGVGRWWVIFGMVLVNPTPVILNGGNFYKKVGAISKDIVRPFWGFSSIVLNTITLA